MSWRPTRTKGLSIVTEDGFMPADTGRSGYRRGVSVDNMLDANVVMAPVHWITRNFTEATLVAEKEVAGTWKPHEAGGLPLRIRRPNPYYSDNSLWKATLVSLILDGNGYWRKIRNVYGEVLELWYLPHFLVEPKWPREGDLYLSHYEYRPLASGLTVDIAPRDIVHFRYDGLNPESTRKGLSPIRPLLREVFTDEEASNFAASILQNMGVPGGVIAPKDTAAAQALDPEDAKSMKEYMKTAFTGNRRGEWLALGTPVQVEQFGFDPNQLMLGNLRDIAEERVCAMLGIPSAVVGFGSGLQSTKVGATMRELRQAAWHNCLIPIQNDVSKQGGMQLLPDFVTRPESYRLNFDRSGVSAFEEDKTETARRAGILVEKGIITVADAQAMTGAEVDERMRFYLIPANVKAFDGDEVVEALATPEPSAPKAPEEASDGTPPAIAGDMNGNSPSQEQPDA